MALINIPDKTVGMQYTADEQNQMKNAINYLDEEVKKPTHSLNEDYFKIVGTVVGPDGETAVPNVIIPFNTAHFIIADGMISLHPDVLP